MKEKPAQINPNMVRTLAAGIYNSTRQGQVAGTDLSTTNSLLQQLIVKQEQNTVEIKTMKTKLHAQVSIKEYRETEKRYDAAARASSLNQ
jgi:hypothetical protein